MRTLNKGVCPAILSDNKEAWDTEYAADPSNPTKKYRYRHPDIKDALKIETHNKCVYCESKIGHNTPGDIEHKWPSSKYPDLHFNWNNLTIACTECNRRKLALDPAVTPFLDPYAGEIEEKVLHYGPVVGWAQGDTEAETTIRTLELDGSLRLALIIRKIEKISDISNLKERISTASDPTLRAALEADLTRRSSKAAEFSGMVASLL